jgi:hypothetical protein
VVTTRPVVSGELLLVSEPLAVVSGPAEDVPSFAQLQQRLLAKRYTDGEVAWVQQLFSGDNESSLQLIDLAAFPAGGGGAGGSASHAAPLSEDAAVRLMFQNAVAEEHQDIAASASRSSDISSLLGIWPEVALLNHSCLPNVVVFALGDRLVVRAAKDLPAGAQLTRSYVGVEVLAPLEQRRDALEQRCAARPH